MKREEQKREMQEFNLSNPNSLGGGGEELCRDFLKGACFRENCKYSHAEGVGAQLPQTSQPICRDFQNGRCFRSSCRFFHGAIPNMGAVWQQQQQQPPGGGQQQVGVCQPIGPQHQTHQYQYPNSARQEPNVVNGNYNRYAQTFGGGGGHQQQLHFGATNSAPEQSSYLASQSNGQPQDYVQASTYYGQPQNQRYSIDQAFIDQSNSSAMGYINSSDDRMYNTNNSIAGMIGAEQLYANASAAAESAAKAFAMQQQQQNLNGDSNVIGTTAALTGGFHSQPFSSNSGVVYSGNQASANHVPQTKQEGFARVPSAENSNFSANSRIDAIDLPLDILDEPKTTLESYQ